MELATPAAGQGSVFRFDDARPEITLPASLEAEDVSDHYPVEVTLNLDQGDPTTESNALTNVIERRWLEAILDLIQ